MAISKGKHVGSSRTNHSHYSENSSDRESNDQEKRPSQTLATQNNTHSPSYVDDLQQGRIEAARREEQAFVDAQRASLVEQSDPVSPADPGNQIVTSDDLDALLADFDMNPTPETAEEVIEAMSADDLEPKRPKSKLQPIFNSAGGLAGMKWVRNDDEGTPK
jgi:hypothetical protein